MNKTLLSLFAGYQKRNEIILSLSLYIFLQFPKNIKKLLPELSAAVHWENTKFRINRRFFYIIFILLLLSWNINHDY
jgi:hypothetical protein